MGKLFPGFPDRRFQSVITGSLGQQRRISGNGGRSARSHDHAPPFVDDIEIFSPPADHFAVFQQFGADHMSVAFRPAVVGDSQSFRFAGIHSDFTGMQHFRFLQIPFFGNPQSPALFFSSGISDDHRHRPVCVQRIYDLIRRDPADFEFGECGKRQQCGQS